MEKVILDKLEWSLFPSASCVTFLSIMSQLLKLVNTAIDQKFVNTVLERLELFINYSRCAAYTVK